MPTPNDINDKLKPVLDEVCAFAIGDFVALASTENGVEAEAELNSKPTERDLRFMVRRGSTPASVICERHIVQCHGGVKLMYSIRRYKNDGVSVLERYFEYELVPWKQVHEKVVEMLTPEPEPQNEDSTPA